MNSLSSDEKRALLKEILEQKAALTHSKESAKKPHEHLVELLSAAFSDKQLSEYGLDSIGMVQLEAELNSLYGVQISSAEWMSLKTIKDLTTLLLFKRGDSVSSASDNLMVKTENSEKTDKILLEKNPGLLFWPALKFLLWRLWPLEARGLENIPRNGPLILCANHTSHIDTLIIASCLRRGQRRSLHIFSARQNFSNTFLRFFLKRLGGIAMERSGDQRPALGIGEKILKENKILLSYPEGTRSRDGRLNELRKGNAYLAMKTNAPMLPIYIKGAREILPPLPKARPSLFDKNFKRLRIKVVFGEPIHPQAYDNETEMTKELRRRIVNLGKTLK